MSKYKSKRVTIDGLNFDSKLEGSYYNYLKLLKRSGLISEIETQFKIEFVLPVNILCFLTIEESASLLQLLEADFFSDSTKWLSDFFGSRPELAVKITKTGCISSPQPKNHQRSCWVLSNKSGKERYFIKTRDEIGISPMRRLCIMKAERMFSYYADFLVDGARVIDTKGVKTPIYKMKKKLIESLYDIEIEEVSKVPTKLGILSS